MRKKVTYEGLQTNSIAMPLEDPMRSPDLPSAVLAVAGGAVGRPAGTSVELEHR